MGRPEERDLGPVKESASEQPDMRLIRLLADGDFHSGEQLGHALRISRAAVWKRLRHLEEIGIPVERVRGKGYRLPGGLDFLDEERVRRAAGKVGGDIDVQLHGSLTSTNSAALDAARAGLGRPLLVLSEHQRAGRGRRGRAWQSPFGRNLCFSLAYEFPGGAARLEGLSLAVGILVADVLQAHGLRERVSLKWPNDVLVAGRKLGGILVELAGDLDSNCTAVIGIGINGAVSVAADAIDQPWTDLLTETGVMPDRNALAGELLAALLERLRVFHHEGFASMQTRWAIYDSCEDRPVTVVVAGKPVSGIARGVSAQGALRLETESGVQLFHGGEVSLRAQ